jgi:hypothetical protein
MEVRRLKMESWRDCRSVVTDHQLNEKQDPEPDPN